MRAGIRIALAAWLVGLGGCESGGDPGGGDPTPPPPAEMGGQAHEARAIECIEAKDWECAATNLRAASELASQPATATRERLATALAAEARTREKAIALARPGRDRLVAAQDAAAMWTLWSEVTGKPLPPAARRVAKIVSHEEAAAARRLPRDDQPPAGPVAPARECCVHCTSGCPCGDSCTSCSQRCRKPPGCAC